MRMLPQSKVFASTCYQYIYFSKPATARCQNNNIHPTRNPANNPIAKTNLPNPPRIEAGSKRNANAWQSRCHKDQAPAPFLAFQWDQMSIARGSTTDAGVSLSQLSTGISMRDGGFRPYRTPYVPVAESWLLVHLR